MFMKPGHDIDGRIDQQILAGTADQNGVAGGIASRIRALEDDDVLAECECGFAPVCGAGHGLFRARLKGPRL